MRPKTCSEVGVCQGLRNCNHCRAPYPFAPGVIERQPRRHRGIGPSALWWAVVVLALLAVLLTGLFVLISLPPTFIARGLLVGFILLVVLIALMQKDGAS